MKAEWNAFFMRFQATTTQPIQEGAARLPSSELHLQLQ